MDRATEIVRKRYDGIAPLYDWIVSHAEGRQGDSWRRRLWDKVEGDRILEIGVGTGLNYPYWGDGHRHITAIDLSEKMLRPARIHAEGSGFDVTIIQMDVQELTFADNTFDTVLGSFLFCSVPDPLKGLREVRRVCRSGGKVVLLEHGASENRALAAIMNLADPVVSWVTGAEHINRKIEKTVEQAGLHIEVVTTLDRASIFKLIEAHKPQG